MIMYASKFLFIALSTVKNHEFMLFTGLMILPTFDTVNSMEIKSGAHIVAD